jgi:hypothetical protein
MLKIEKKIKLLSVNECWQGRRFKTPAYKDYEKILMYTLPNYEINYDKYYIICIFNFSSNRADWDNPIKPLQDILQKKYKFNDCNITNALVLKNIVPKKDEGFQIYLGDASNFCDDIKFILNKCEKQNS